MNYVAFFILSLAPYHSHMMKDQHGKAALNFIKNMKFDNNGISFASEIK